MQLEPTTATGTVPQQPTHTSGPAPKRKATHHGVDLTSSEPAQDPAQDPAQNRMQRTTTTRKSHTTATRPAVYEYNSPPELTTNCSTKWHSSHYNDSDDNISDTSTCSGYSNTSNSNGSNFRTSHQQTQPPGMLSHRFPINNNNQSSSGKAEAEYILHWLCILGDRPTKFERAIARNRHHLSDPIALFAIVCHRSTVIKAAHGFNTIIMQDEDHAANRRIGFFLGGRIAAANEHGWHLQNLPLCTTHDWNTLLTNYTSSPAPKHTICNSNDVFLPPTNTGK